MPLFVIAYDMRSKTHDYREVYDLLRVWGATRLKNSMWLLDHAVGARGIRDTMKAHLHDDDTVAVVELSPNGDWSTWNVKEHAADWLAEKIK